MTDEIIWQDPPRPASKGIWIERLTPLRRGGLLGVDPALYEFRSVAGSCAIYARYIGPEEA